MPSFTIISSGRLNWPSHACEAISSVLSYLPASLFAFKRVFCIVNYENPKIFFKMSINAKFVFIGESPSPSLRWEEVKRRLS